MKKLIIAVVFASIGLSAFASIAETTDTKTIRFATEASYPPFEFMDAKNEMQGFDIDLANAICKQLKADCTFTNQAFDSLIPGLRFHRFDAIIAGIDITEARKKKVAFTNPYYENSALFIARKGTVDNISALAGKRVGMQNGTTHQQFLKDKHPEVIEVPYDSYQNAMLDLKNGRLDAVFGDTAVVNEWLKKDQKEDKILEAVGSKITDPDYFGTGLGIAVNATNTELLNELNQALLKLQQDDTYTQIYQKWFP